MLILSSFGPSNTAMPIYYTVLNADKTVSQARTNAGVSEVAPGSGVYGANVGDAVIEGKTVLWDIDGTAKVAAETFPPPTPTASENAAAVRAEIETELGRIDVATSTRLPTAVYTAPNNADIGILLDLAQADEEVSPTRAIKKHKDTGDILLDKTVSGGNLIGTITIRG